MIITCGVFQGKICELKCLSELIVQVIYRLYILRVEITTGLEENFDGENGDFIVISTASDVDLHDLASAAHQSVCGDWNQ